MIMCWSVPGPRARETSLTLAGCSRTRSPPTRSIAHRCDTSWTRAPRGQRGGPLKAWSGSSDSTRDTGRCGPDTIAIAERSCRGHEKTRSRSWSRDRARYEPLGVVAVTRGERDVLDEHRFAGALEGRDDVARRHLVAAWANAATFGQDPRDLTRQIDEVYPGLRSRGGARTLMPVREARMMTTVREHGPRPLERGQFDEWRERSVETPRSRAGRSR